MYKLKLPNGTFVNVTASGRAPIVEHAKYKYVVHLEGNTASSRLAQVGLPGCLGAWVRRLWPWPWPGGEAGEDGGPLTSTGRQPVKVRGLIRYGIMSSRVDGQGDRLSHWARDRCL